MKKIGELNAVAGNFVIYYDADDKCHYKLYNKWYYHGWHKELLQKCSCLSDCTKWINNFIKEYDETERMFYNG